jgi:ribonuclease VapC
VILDSSAIVAILLDEPERAEFLGKVDAADVVGVGAPTLAEAGVVLSARIGRDAGDVLGRFFEAIDAETVPFTADHWREALTAWSRHGRGRHAAALNLGDCLAYAIARLARQPLLAKGDDFPKTDLDLA